MILKIFALAVFSFLFVSCSSSNEQTTKPNASLTNTRWVLRVMNDKKIFTPESGKEVYITFSSEGNNSNGSSGCNSFFSTYEVSGKNMKFTGIGGTEMFCENRMETEAEFYKVLERTKRYRIKGDNLYLYDSNKVIAKFEAVYLK